MKTRINWEVTEWCEYLDGCWAVSLTGEDKYGNEYVASGYAVQDGSVGGEITDVFDIEPVDDFETRHRRELNKINENYNRLLGSLSVDVKYCTDEITKRSLIRILKKIGEWDDLCDQFGIDKKTGEFVGYNGIGYATCGIDNTKLSKWNKL